MTAPPRRRLAVALAAAPFVAAWFAACGGSEPPQVTSGGDAAIEASGATGDASPRPDGGAAADVGVGADADASARCAQLETRDTDCKKPFKPKACLFLDCYDRLFSAADSAALTSCIVGRPCDKSDDDCFAEVTAKYAGDTGGVAFQAACLAKRDACLEGGAGFVDDYCVGRVYAMLTDRPVTVRGWTARRGGADRGGCAYGSSAAISCGVGAARSRGRARRLGHRGRAPSRSSPRNARMVALAASAWHSRA